MPKKEMRTRFILLSICCFIAANASFAENDFRFIPANPPEMTPLTNRHSPAYAAANYFRHGVNLGTQPLLQVPPVENWQDIVCGDAGKFARMRAVGFDHVRLGIEWPSATGPAPDYLIAPEVFTCVDCAVTNALAAGLGVMIHIIWFKEFYRDPAAETERFVAIWRQIAAHYEKFPDRLAFELMNEPHGAATTKVINPIYARTIAEIRKTNPHRTIFAGPGEWNSVDELKNLVLPPDDNLIVTVHCYDPFIFTHQGHPRQSTVAKVTGIRFPGPPATPFVPDPAAGLSAWWTNWIQKYNTLPTAQNPCSPLAFAEKMKLARAWSDYYGRPVHVGEFGVYSAADPESRVRWLAAIRHAFDENNLGWCLWEWSAGFGFWDKKDSPALPGLHEALFGK